MPIALQYIAEAYQVTVDVAVRPLQRVAHPGLSCQVHHPIDTRGFGEKRPNRLPVGDIQIPDAKVGLPLQLRQPRPLKLHLVIVDDGIRAHDLLIPPARA